MKPNGQTTHARYLIPLTCEVCKKDFKRYKYAVKRDKPIRCYDCSRVNHSYVGKRAKFMPENAGTTVVTVQCAHCKLPITRALVNIRNSLSRSGKVVCDTCTINRFNAQGKFVDKKYEIKQVSKKYYGVENKLCYKHQKWHGELYRTCRIKISKHV